MKKKVIIFLIPVLGILICIVFLFANDNIGISSSKLESDIRASQKVKDDWIVDGSISDTMAAFISYPENMSDHTFSVYVKRTGIYFGYFFRGGGHRTNVERGIMEYVVDGNEERAFISMNQQQVMSVTIDDGDSVREIDIDCNKPFAIIIPMNAGNITFYDVDGRIVEYGESYL